MTQDPPTKGGTVRTTPVVAGVDLGSVAVAQADSFVGAIVAAAPDAGVDADLLFVDTHRVVPEEGDFHAVLTVSAAGVHEWQLWRMCLTALRTRPAQACTVGRHAVGDGAALAATRAAVHERTRRIAGRCVHFPGAERLVGTMTVGEIVGLSAIDAVTEVGDAPLAASVEVVTGAHVRPRWEFGALVLHVQHAGGGLYRPFEVSPRVAVS